MLLKAIDNREVGWAERWRCADAWFPHPVRLPLLSLEAARVPLAATLLRCIPLRCSLLGNFGKLDQLVTASLSFWMIRIQI